MVKKCLKSVIIWQSNGHEPPFHKLDIIGAMMIVWSVREEIIRSILCSIVCNCNMYAQCNAHTFEQT